MSDTLTIAARNRLTPDSLRQAIPLTVLIALVLAVSSRDSDFLSADSLRALADSSTPLLILGVGVTLVVMCGGIDLSVAALASFGSVLFAMWVPSMGFWAAVPAIAVTTGAGLVQGVVHVVAQIPSFVVTLGGMALWSGVALTVSDAAPIAMRNRTILDFGDKELWGVPLTVIAALVVALIAAVAMVTTPLGRWIRATGNSETAAYLAGVPVRATKIGSFAFSGFCAGAAAVVIVARGESGGPSSADTLLLPVVAAVVVGGTAITGGHGGIGRTVVGVLIVAVLRVGLSVIDISQTWEQVLYGALIIIAAALTIERSKLAVLK